MTQAGLKITPKGRRSGLALELTKQKWNNTKTNLKDVFQYFKKEPKIGARSFF